MNKKEVKKNSLSNNLNKIITIGLIAALILMAAGFLLNSVINNGKIDMETYIEKLEENTFRLKSLYSNFKNTDNLTILLLTYLGIFILILVPVIGVIFSLIYFTLKKNWKLTVICTGVLIVLILSGIIGFIKP